MNRFTLHRARALCLMVVGLVAMQVIAGDVNPPPGPVGDTLPTLGMKTLQQVEPRIPVNTLAGTALAHHRIASAGSYYLTADIISVLPGEIGILVDAANVSIDLCGFSVVGPGSGTGPGILVSPQLHNLIIRNGTIRDWGAQGVSAGSSFGCLYSDLLAVSNGAQGFEAGDGCVFRSCVARGNAGDGFYAESGSAFTNCTSRSNSGGGFNAFDSITIIGCSATNNGAIGIWINGGTVVNSTASHNGSGGIANFGQALAVIHCDVSQNTEDGVFLDSPGRVEGCTIYSNGNNGIQVDDGSVVINNTCDANGDILPASGIYATGARNRIEGNNVTDQDAGIECGAAGNLVIRNSASGNTLNYDIVAGNTIGPIVTSVDISTSSNPHANYAY